MISAAHMRWLTERQRVAREARERLALLVARKNRPILPEELDPDPMPEPTFFEPGAPGRRFATA